MLKSGTLVECDGIVCFLSTNVDCLLVLITGGDGLRTGCGIACGTGWDTGFGTELAAGGKRVGWSTSVERIGSEDFFGGIVTGG